MNWPRVGVAGFHTYQQPGASLPPLASGGRCAPRPDAPWPRAATLPHDYAALQSTHYALREQYVIEDPGDIVAFAGDWHGNREWAIDCIEMMAARGVKTVLHAGDFGICWPSTSGRTYMKRVSEALDKHDMNLFVTPGNHENYSEIDGFTYEQGSYQVRPRIHIFRRGARWTWRNITFCSLGGAVSMDKKWRSAGKDWWASEAIAPMDAERVVDAGQVDVLITHDAPDLAPFPYEPMSWPETEVHASEQHRKLLSEVVQGISPCLLWHGHHHRSHVIEISLPTAYCRVRGLDCDGSSFRGNIDIVTMAIVESAIAQRRQLGVVETVSEAA